MIAHYILKPGIRCHPRQIWLVPGQSPGLLVLTHIASTDLADLIRPYNIALLNLASDLPESTRIGYRPGIQPHYAFYSVVIANTHKNLRVEVCAIIRILRHTTFASIDELGQTTPFCGLNLFRSLLPIVHVPPPEVTAIPNKSNTLEREFMSSFAGSRYQVRNVSCRNFQSDPNLGAAPLTFR